MRLLIFVLIISLSCTTQLFTNKSTSAIGSMYGQCLKKGAWDSLFVRHNIDNIKDSVLIEALFEFENMPFETYILYMQNDPVELIGISTDKYMVRYVFNPELRSKVLDGYMLNESEKNRILNRVQMLLMEFQCEDGVKQSLNAIKKRKE